ncbi:hypothetical protein AB6G29_24035 [Providencia hangzhouensis]|uniref:hypothetical protein n=1 Tax=Providencia hangzhouensis TaxID=3031799 RepID=UPI0034DDA40F
MNIPEPTFTPVLDATSNDAILIDGCIIWNKVTDERKVCNDRYEIIACVSFKCMCC